MLTVDKKNAEQKFNSPSCFIHLAKHSFTMGEPVTRLNRTAVICSPKTEPKVVKKF